MKTLQKLAKLTKSTLITITLVCLCQRVKCENEQPATQLTELSQRINKDPGGFGDKTSVKDVTSFAAILPKISFEPNFEALPDNNAFTPDGSASIEAATDIVIAILRSEIVKNVKLVTQEDIALTAIDLYVGKLEKSIDPNWKWIPVYANVGPPPGTPNAASGMNPEAIADPKLKKQYLDLIKKNQNNGLINSQQSELRTARMKFLITISTLISTVPGEGWNKTDVIARFCKSEESKKIIEEKLK